MNKDKLKLYERYNWKNQPERLIYIGKKGNWHQFVKVDARDIVWCEVLDSDLHMFEETQAISEPVAWIDENHSGVITETHRKYLQENYPKAPNDKTIPLCLCAQPTSLSANEQDKADAESFRNLKKYLPNETFDALLIALNASLTLMKSQQEAITKKAE